MAVHSPETRNGSASRKSMKANFWAGKPFHMEVREVSRPRLHQETDVIVRLTTSAICGSDLHIYRGVLSSSTVPYSVGHEGVGVVTEVGSGVSTVKCGDRVVILDMPDDGHFNPEKLGEPLQIYGVGEDFGDLNGLQAEYARVPFADDSLLVIPNNPRNDLDYVTLSDIFPTAWGGLTMSGFQAGDTVVIFGAGPVGQLTAYSAILRGAAKIYIIDHVQARLDLAETLGAIPINLTASKKGPAAQILAHEPHGVNRVIDAIGYECVNTKLIPQADFVLREAVSVCGIGGGINLTGVYVSGPPNRGQPRADSIPDEIKFDIGAYWIKGITISSGGIDAADWVPEILPLMLSGKAKPGFVFSDEIGINEVPEGYKRFDQAKETKIAIRFPWEFEKETSKPYVHHHEKGEKRRAVRDHDAEDESADERDQRHNGESGMEHGAYHRNAIWARRHSVKRRRAY